MDQQEDVLEMMLAHPFILPANSKLYKGYLLVDGKDYYIEFEESFTGIKLIITKDLEQFEPHINKLSGETSKLRFLENLKTIIMSRNISSCFTNHSESYWHILTEYAELREFYINIHSSVIASDLSHVKIGFLDDSSRLHELQIGTNFQDTRYVFHVIEHSFPEQNQLFDKCSSLKIIYEKFLGYINHLQSYFNVMDDLDRNCWILDPIKPTKKDCYRRIGLDINLSIIVTINPWVDNQIPDVKLLGPERLVETRKQKVIENLIDWNTNGDFTQELLKVLDLDHFYSKPTECDNEILLCNIGECCICFSLYLNDKLPEVVCPNSSCEQLFHKECLLQWLMAVNARQSFKKLYGDCPNCEKTISCPL